MIYITEILDEAVNHDTLETALIKAAEEEGLKIDDNKSGKKDANKSETNGCTQTNFYFKKRFHPTIEVKIYGHGNSIDFYCVYVDDFFGFESQDTVKKYVSRVRDYLKKH